MVNAGEAQENAGAGGKSKGREPREIDYTR